MNNEEKRETLLVTSNFTVLTERRKYYGKITIGANQLLFIIIQSVRFNIRYRIR